MGSTKGYAASFRGSRGLWMRTAGSLVGVRGECATAVRREVVNIQSATGTLTSPAPPARRGIPFPRLVSSKSDICTDVRPLSLSVLCSASRILRVQMGREADSKWQPYDEAKSW